ncbi:class I tRNA ligase family protein [Photorhabdus luminescens]|uniref:Methionyl-tRNA synthetase n=1 Tax=Photorhabdus luminescens subsp. sonorensis TaxID=1173677 RepID=A0A5C4RH96_PHOLU|nr:class I tRNA ligase family protein [Photorhabdus luminescens]TNH42947.1 cupin domain-containing protein [Photorhabdus luminescens subsp. sonorensis]
MIIHYYDSTEMSKQFGIDIASIKGLSISAGWGKVTPGNRSNSHQHDETEMFVILNGQGKLIVDGHSYPVKAGTVAQFEPFESHVLENTGDEDVIFFLQYRRDAARAQASASSLERQNPKRPQFVFSTPPTPNGDLHLGHLSGPYLGADAYVRYQRLIGNFAWHITGSDDYQSYVIALAKREKTSPSSVAEYYSKEILQTLNMMDIEVEQYTVTNDSLGYIEGAQRFFTRTQTSGKVAFRETPAFRDATTGEFLYEVNVFGDCPGCGSSTSGNICEECGEPNLVVDLASPVSKISQTTPKTDSINRFTLPLHEFEKTVVEHHQIGRVPVRMRELAHRVFSRPQIDLPISHISDWGITPKEKEGDGQVIWVWPEMSYGFLYGIEALGKKLNQPWKADQPDNSWKIVHFFGYDNSFYHSILYPVLYRLAYPDWQPDIDYHYNEFYLLEGKKFSTSRRHAIWGKEILTPESVDAIRYYLCLTRPEQEQTNFQFDVYKAELCQTLIGVWQKWLHDLGLRVTRLFMGRAPDTGIWTKEHVAFWAQLNDHLRTMTDALNADGFSLRRAAKQLKILVQDTVDFSHSQQRLMGLEIWKDEYRTTIALELASAQLLSVIAIPLMPRFAKRLAIALGNEVVTSWPQQAELITPGHIIKLSETLFFVAPDTQTETSQWKWLVEKLNTLTPNANIQPDSILINLGLSSLAAVTLQYQLLYEQQVDVSIETLLHQSLDTIAKQIAQQQTLHTQISGGAIV